MAKSPKTGEISLALVTWLIVTITIFGLLLMGARYIGSVFGRAGPNLVLNPSFEQWQNGTPKNWQVQKDSVSQATDSATGKFALRIRGKTTSAVQDIAGLKPNTAYLISLETKLGSGSASFTYSYKTQVKGIPAQSVSSVRRDFPESANYSSLTFLVRLPEGLNSITGQIGIQTSSQDVLVDNVSVSAQGSSLFQLLAPPPAQP